MLIDCVALGRPGPERAIELLPGRAAMLPESRTLLVADLHLGKAATFRRSGLPVPEGSSRADLARLAAMVATRAARRLVILGDLFHAARGCTPAVFAEFARFRRSLAGVRVLLVSGNHDRGVVLPADLGIDERVERLHEPPWLLLHDPADAPEQPDGPTTVIAGHLHPRLAIRSPSGDRLCERCFVADRGRLVLPAFGSFTGSAVVGWEPGMRLWAAGEEAVVEVTRLAELAAGRRRSRRR